MEGSGNIHVLCVSTKVDVLKPENGCGHFGLKLKSGHHTPPEFLTHPPTPWGGECWGNLSLMSSFSVSTLITRLTHGTDSQEDTLAGRSRFPSQSSFSVEEKMQGSEPWKGQGISIV